MNNRTGREVKAYLAQREASEAAPTIPATEGTR